MRKVCFLYNSLFDQAVLSTEPEGCEQTPDWPLSNLQTTILSEAWKTSGTGNVRLLIDLLAPQAINAFGLASHNLGAATLVTFRAYSDAWLTEVYAQEFEAVGPLLGWLEGGWLEGGWLGYPLPDDQILYPRMTSLFVFDELVGARYVAVDFANGDDEFFLGEIFLGELFRPDRNFAQGFEIEPVDSSVEDESLGGVVFTDVGEQYHEMRFTLNRLSEAEAIGGSFWRFAHYVGRRKPFIVQMMSTTLKHQRLTTLVGKFSKNPAERGLAPDRYSAEFNIREMI